MRSLRRSRGVALLVAASAVTLAACGAASAPRVATLGTSAGNARARTSTTPPRGNATALLDQWATCMRGNGDPDQADPTVDVHDVIHVTYPNGYNPKEHEGDSQEGDSTENDPCSAYLTEASTALGGQPPDQNPTTMVAFSRCMRANGFPGFPDPTDVGGTYRFPLGIHPGNNGVAVAGPNNAVDPNSPIVKISAKLCSQKVGVPAWGDTPGTAPGSIVEGAHG